MLQRVLTWIVIIGAVLAGVLYSGRQPVWQDGVQTLTTLLVVGLLAQWLFRETPGFRAGKFWSALLTLGIVMVGLRWLIHR